MVIVGFFIEGGSVPDFDGLNRKRSKGKERMMNEEEGNEIEGRG